MIACVYVIRHPSGYFYIGSSEEIIKRRTRHYFDLRAGVHHSKKLQAVWNQLEQLDWEIRPCNDRQSAYTLEDEMIKQNMNNPLMCNNYYVGGGFLSDYPAEVKEKISKALKGRPASEEAKQKMSLVRKGKPKTAEWSDKIAEAARKKVSIEGVVYESITEACNRLGLTYFAIKKKLGDSAYPDWIRL